MKKLLLAGVAGFALIGAANAAPLISGEISINGDDVFTLGPPPSITFTALGNVGGASGSFDVVPNCDNCVHMINELTQSSTGTLFTASSGGNTVSFDIAAGSLSATVSTNPNPSLDAIEVTGDGTLTLDGTSQPGSFVLTSQGPADENFTFSATATTEAVPAPPIGATLPGVLAVLMALGLYHARRTFWD